MFFFYLSLPTTPKKYVGACLTSILNQTFQNFEVIVVDDCSTDKSCEVVENFIPKFGGRLKLLHMKKNSGGPGEPSNKGLRYVRGKYIFIMDNDDLILRQAVEVLYNMAEKFGADLVYMEQGFKFSGDENKMFPEPSDLQGMGWQGRGPFIDKPTFESDDIAERIEIFLQSRMGWPVWEKFFKRDLVLKNDIIFPNLKSSQDIIFTVELICHAKKILRIPYPLYVYRRNNLKSICATERDNEEKLIFWTDINLRGLDFLADFLNSQKFFQENPHYKLAMLDFFNGVHFNQLSKSIEKIPPEKIYDILETYFIKQFGIGGNLIAYLCQSSNLLMYRLISAEQRAEKLEKQLRELQVKL